MKEDLLYFVWKTKYFSHEDLFTTDGEPIKILDYGRQNPYSGPDFSNAKIMIADTLWVGNVEMHILSSDWTKHNHESDDSYQNVILHVVSHMESNTGSQKVMCTLLEFLPGFYDGVLMSEY